MTSVSARLFGVGLVLLVAGCAATNRHCVSSTSQPMPMLVCTSFGNGGCNGYSTVTTYMNVCTAWRCSDGFHERNGQCVKNQVASHGGVAVAVPPAERDPACIYSGDGVLVTCRRDGR